MTYVPLYRNTVTCLFIFGGDTHPLDVDIFLFCRIMWTLARVPGIDHTVIYLLCSRYIVQGTIHHIHPLQVTRRHKIEM